MSNGKPKKIRLGICMAGAVSAGAYTAGVVDYLIETLERWQQRKNIIQNKKEKGETLTPAEELVPLHETVVEVLSGASAGGMTAAVLGYSFNDNSYLNKRNGEIIPGNYNLPGQTDTTTKLYKSWIDMVDDESGTTLSKMMRTDDVVSINKMKSLLNSTPIDEIAQRAIPAKINFQPPPYISQNLSLILSVTNLEGIPIDIRFSNIEEENPTRNMLKMHSGFLHYQFRKQDYDIDFPQEIITEESKDHLAVAAKATGAFPFGLANRKISVHPGFLTEFKKRLKENYKLNVNLEIKDNSAYEFTAVDGGAINNEPIGTTVKILESKKKKHYPDEEFFVVLIDPFPSITNARQQLTYTKPGTYTMTEQAGKLLSAFMNQSAFKQEDLLKGMEMEKNRFLIYPAKRRYYFLACGLLGGFSGFFKKAFREHDYQLGRKNCQAFLRYYFGVSPDEFKTTTGIELTPDQVKKWAYNVNYGRKEKPELLKMPLIPDMLLLENERSEIEVPVYNGITTAEMKKVTESLNGRVRKIVDASFPDLLHKLTVKKINEEDPGQKEGKEKKKKVLAFFLNLFSGLIKNKITGLVTNEINTHLYNAFSPQSVKQDILVTFTDTIEAKGKKYQKIKGVFARVAEGGEKIVSKTKDGIETTNIASAGDYIVRNETTTKEEYIIKPGKFNERYVHSKDDYYVPNDKARVYGLKITPDIIYQYKLDGLQSLVTSPEEKVFIEASWNESQRIRLNDYLVCPLSKTEVYRIAEFEFNETYEEIP